MKVHVGDIRPNPFRHLDRYPIKRDKVEALKQSIESTGFWDNIVAREGPDGLEIAYGHHRLIALQEHLGDDTEVSLIVRPLDDEQMLKIMAAENMQEWAALAEVEQETVRAVIEAARDGLISLPEGSLAGRPAEYRSGRDIQARSIARFLGWKEWRVQMALRALDAVEEGVVPEDAVSGVGPEVADHIVRATAKVQREAVARGLSETRATQVTRRIASHIAEQARTGDIGKRGLPEAAMAELNEVVRPPTNGKPVVPGRVALRLYKDIAHFFEGDIEGRSRADIIKTIAENRDAVELRSLAGALPPWATQIADALQRMSIDAQRHETALRAEPAQIAGGHS